MNKQLSRGACFGVVVASMFVFVVIAGMFSPYAASNYLGVYIAYLLFQLIFFYIFRTVYKNKDRGWAVPLTFIGFAFVPTLLGIATQHAPPPVNALAPASAFVLFIAGWWIFFAMHKTSADTAGNEHIP